MKELAEIVSKNEEQILAEWTRDMGKAAQRTDLIGKAELEEQCRTLLTSVVAGLRISGPDDISAGGWNTTRELLREISTSRARQGFAASDVATFVLSLKQPLFSAIRRDQGGSQDQLFDMIWTATELLVRMGNRSLEKIQTLRRKSIL